MIEHQSAIDRIYAGFKAVYGYPQGKCGQIAEKIQKEIGGEIVAGLLVFITGEREHWWVEKNGETIDPMSDELMETDPHYHREVHRDTTKRYWHNEKI